MPQRQFWTQQHPVACRWLYSCDPSAPDTDPMITYSTLDQSGATMAFGAVFVPADDVHAAVSAALVETWEGYLFGDVLAPVHALRGVKRRFAGGQALHRAFDS